MPDMPPLHRICTCIYNRHHEHLGRNETKRRRNVKDHGIDFADLEDFFSGDLLTREDLRETYGERRYQSVGVFNGVGLFVV